MTDTGTESHLPERPNCRNCWGSGRKWNGRTGTEPCACEPDHVRDTCDHDGCDERWIRRNCVYAYCGDHAAEHLDPRPVRQSREQERGRLPEPAVEACSRCGKPLDPSPTRNSGCIKCAFDAGERAATERIVAWLRSECEYQSCGDSDLAWELDRPITCGPCEVANAIERGEHEEGAG